MHDEREVVRHATVVARLGAKAREHRDGPEGKRNVFGVWVK